MKVVFFDAEGTLYRPKNGKRPEDFWEGGEHTLERAKEHFELNCCVAETLERLKQRNYIIAVVSKHKDHLLSDLLQHLGIDEYFSGIMIGEDKAPMMLNFLQERDISKNDAIMVGDTYELDIAPAESVGIRGLHLDGRKTQCIQDLFGYIDEIVSQ
ncbi:MAG: HAD family hydrolase [Thermoplasmata archaeon]|nr:HAD family hydrolase [Thermoplasmata archaeon]